MSKIVQAVNSMISNQRLITSVLQGSNELFFLYNGKYKWSLQSSVDDGDIVLFYYPGSEPIEKLANSDVNWSNTSMIAYRASEIGTREARASFHELANVIKEKLYGVNEVLEDIISDDIPF